MFDDEDIFDPKYAINNADDLECLAMDLFRDLLTSGKIDIDKPVGDAFKKCISIAEQMEDVLQERHSANEREAMESQPKADVLQLPKLSIVNPPKKD
ncbi:hypothetical protein [Ralstonia phage RP13]|nr:hypothetical protein [Ralstonia phage RP13]